MRPTIMLQYMTRYVNSIPLSASWNDGIGSTKRGASICVSIGHLVGGEINGYQSNPVYFLRRHNVIHTSFEEIYNIYKGSKKAKFFGPPTGIPVLNVT